MSDGSPCSAFMPTFIEEFHIASDTLLQPALMARALSFKITSETPVADWTKKFKDADGEVEMLLSDFRDIGQLSMVSDLQWDDFTSQAPNFRWNQLRKRVDDFRAHSEPWLVVDASDRHDNRLEVGEDLLHTIFQCPWCHTPFAGPRALLIHKQKECYHRLMPCPVKTNMVDAPCGGSWLYPANPERARLFDRRDKHIGDCVIYKEKALKNYARAPPRPSHPCLECQYIDGELSRLDVASTTKLREHIQCCRAKIRCCLCKQTVEINQVAFSLPLLSLSIFLTYDYILVDNQ